MKRINPTLVLSALIALAISASSAAQTMTVKQAEQYLSQSFPNAKVKQLKPATMPGIYEAIIDGTIYYLSEDGAFMFSGPLYDLRTQANLTEQTYNEIRKNIVSQINDDNSISYAPDHYQYTVAVFSDVDCPYCRKFHSQLDEVTALGIRVNYVLTPYRGSAAYQNAVNVWCAKDRRAAFTHAKQGLAVEQKECTHPIESNLQLAELAGVKGTPAFLLSNGQLLNGYRQPVELLDEIKRANPQ